LICARDTDAVSVTGKIYAAIFRKGSRMDVFFKTASVAVIGVSNSPENLGREIVQNLVNFRFQGAVYLVGPKGGAFLGHKIYRSVGEIPDQVDLATLLVPASAVPEVLTQCGEKGIRRVVVQSAGFSEMAEERTGLEDQVRTVLTRYGMRMIGPNCLGILNRHTGLAVPFMLFESAVPAGNISVISQSGGVGAMTVNALETCNLGLSKFASIGNKLDVDETDLLDYLIEDPETGIIYCYLESISNGRKLMETAARSKKPILVHKANRGRPGAIIARSHSASLSTDDGVAGAAFRQSGIIRVMDQPDAIGWLKALSLPPVGGNRLAIISRSGGHAVMAADAAEEFAFELPPFPEDFTRMAEQSSRAKVITFHNPLDLGDVFDMQLYGELAEKAIQRDDIDALLFILNYQGLHRVEDHRSLIGRLGDINSACGKPVAVCVFTTRTELDTIRRRFRAPIFGDPREAVQALARNRLWEHTRRRPGGGPFLGGRPRGADVAKVRAILDGAAAGQVPAGVLGTVLSSYGIPLVPWAAAESESGALEAAARLGYPVALKTASPDVIHKTEAGGVILGIEDGHSLRAAYEGLLRLGPSAIVQKMAGPGVEWLAGGRQDSAFGPVVVSGLGGIYVEVFRETGLRVAPVSGAEAGRLVGESRGVTLLEGVRGGKVSDRAALEDLIVRVSWLLADFPRIGELDLNPVRVFEKGCAALDWRATMV
jgi:acetate---CoA ligase (ADP-forming)